MQQLDIFADSRDRVLVNLLADAVVGNDPAQARAAAAALREEFPDDRHLAPAQALIDALAAEALAGDSPLPDVAAALAARSHIEQVVQASALTLLGSEAAPTWLAARWRALARRASALPFDSAHPQAHAAALWLQGRAWDEAAAAVEGIESWRRKPQPLAWMVQARWHLAGQDATWPLLAELAWLAPPRLPALLALLRDTRLLKLARAFEAAFEDTPDWSWWPAWLLVEQALLAAPLDTAQTAADAAPERTFKLLLSLLRLERQGRHHEIIALRRQLQALQPTLFSAYMATR
jgi:hypothetical protein